MQKMIVVSIVGLALSCAVLAKPVGTPIILRNASQRTKVVGVLNNLQMNRYYFEAKKGESITLSLQKTIPNINVSVMDKMGNYLCNTQVAPKQTCTMKLPYDGMYFIQVYQQGNQTYSRITNYYRFTLMTERY